MLKRDLLPFPTNAAPQRDLLRWFFERFHDLKASLPGTMRDPLQVQLRRGEAHMNVALASLLAVMLYVAALSLMTHHVLSHMATGIDRSLQTRVTYEILPDTAKPDDRKGMEEKARTLQENLRKIPGILRAEPVGRDAMAALLAPWLGARTSLDQLPLPLLLDVQIDPQKNVDKKALQGAIAGMAGVTLDDHARFQGDLARLVSSLQGVAGYVLLMAFAALMFTSYFAAEATFHMNRDMIEILHLIGADDSAVAQHMGLAVVRVALMAAGIALIFAFATLIGLWLSSAPLDLALFPNFRMGLTDWLALVLQWFIMLAVAVALCLLAARFTVLRALRRLL